MQVSDRIVCDEKNSRGGGCQKCLLSQSGHNPTVPSCRYAITVGRPRNTKKYLKIGPLSEPIALSIAQLRVTSRPSNVFRSRSSAWKLYQMPRCSNGAQRIE